MLKHIPASFRHVTIPVPVRRAWQIGRTLYDDMVRCDLFAHANGMAYVTLLSIVPCLAAVFSLVSIFRPVVGEGATLINQVQEFVIKNLAVGTGAQVAEYLQTFIAKLNIAEIGVTGIAALLVGLILLLKQIEEALNRIWLVDQGRHIFTRFVYFWTFLTLGVFLASIAFGVVSEFNFKNLLPTAVIGTETIKAGGGFLATFVPFVATFVFFLFLFKIVPNCPVPLKEAAYGALAATILFRLASAFFGYFIANLTRYQAIYGALAAIPSFLVWLYFIWVIILLGALLSWRLHQGFSFGESMDIDRGADATPAERQRNAHLQFIVPALLLVIIHRHFALGLNLRGGITGQWVVDQTKLPIHWVVDALRYLQSIGHIAGAAADSTNDAEADADNWLGRHYLPTMPAEKITMDKLWNDVAGPTAAWLANWHHGLPVDALRIADFLAKRSASNLRQVTLAELIQATAP